MADRADMLLAAAAAELANGSDPFHESFLVEHDITMTECYDLSERMSVILRGFLRASRETQNVILLVGATADVDISPQALEDSIRFAAVTKRLATIGQPHREDRGNG